MERSLSIHLGLRDPVDLLRQRDRTIAIGWFYRDRPGWQEHAPKIVKSAIRPVIFGVIATILIAPAR